MPDDLPTFIFGITPRSGTNYLSDLLCVRPDGDTPAPLLEDYLLHHAHHLAVYVNSMSGSWQPRLAVEGGHEDRQWRCLGNGLLAALPQNDRLHIASCRAQNSGVDHGRY